jgi:hypothetical protein
MTRLEQALATASLWPSDNVPEKLEVETFPARYRSGSENAEY